MNKSNPEIFSARRPIVLIGMMGAGKTSVGAELAKLLAVPFVDADKEIVKVSGLKSVAEIFETHGEAEFRIRERQVISRLLTEGGRVLSLGGGAFMNDETRNHIKRSAFSVWLKVDQQILLARVLRNNSRPLLQGGDAAEKLLGLLQEREPVYCQADLTVVCDDRPISETAKHVRDSLQAARAFQN